MMETLLGSIVCTYNTLRPSFHGDLKIALRGGGGGGDMNARRRRGGGLEKWTSVTGPLTRGSFVGLFENLPATMSAVGWHDTPANG